MVVINNKSKMAKKFKSLKTINKENLEKIRKDKPIVYGIFTKTGKLQKVGRAKRGRGPERILESVKEIRKKKKGASKFSIIPVKSVKEAKKLETALIKRTKPPFNKEEKGK